MKVGVLMFYDDNIREYAAINYNINKKYCEKYNIDLICSNTRRHTQRHPAWERLPLILEHIDSYDYVIWIDADAYFYKEAHNIIDVIKKHLNMPFIFSNDIGNNNINTGFFIIKNCEYSKRFIEEWCYNDELYINNPFPNWWDQGVLIKMYNDNTMSIRENSICIEYGILQHFNVNNEQELKNNPFILHLSEKSRVERFQTSQEYYNKYIVYDTISKPI